MRTIFIALVGLTVFSGPVFADIGEPGEIGGPQATESAARSKAKDFEVSGYVESGARSQAEDYDDEADDLEYSYQRYSAALSQKVNSRLEYDIGSLVYNKDYKASNNLDSRSRQYQNNWLYYFKKETQERLSGLLKCKYQTKRYENSPLDDYDQLKVRATLAQEKKDKYLLALTFGLDNYDYQTAQAKDQRDTVVQLAAKDYLLDSRLVLVTTAGVIKSQKIAAGREKTKSDLAGGCDYLFKKRWIEKLAVRAGYAQRDSKDDEEYRDQDLDYKWRQYQIETTHKIQPKLKTTLKYQFFQRDYADMIYDHRGWFWQNRWQYELFNGESARAWAAAGINHKVVDYTLGQTKDYVKESIDCKATYLKKEKWQASAGWQGDFYDYAAAAKDKVVNYLNVTAEKFFQEGDIRVGVGVKYKLTDNKDAADTARTAVRLEWKARF
jgi:hypothetical protein